MEQLEARLTTISEEFKCFFQDGPAGLRFPFDNWDHGYADDADYGGFGSNDGLLEGHHPGCAVNEDTAMNVVQEPTTPPGTPPRVADDSLFSGSPTPCGFSVPPARPESLTPDPRASTPSDWSVSQVMSPTNRFQELRDEAPVPNDDSCPMDERAETTDRISQQPDSAEEVAKPAVNDKELVESAVEAGGTEDKMQGVETSPNV